MDALLRYLRWKSFARGREGHNPVWVVVAGALWMIIRARRSDVVYRTRLRSGEGLVISSNRGRSPRSGR